MSIEVTKEFMGNVRELLKLAHDRCDSTEQFAEKIANTLLNQGEVIKKLTEDIIILKKKVLILEGEKIHGQN